MAQSGAEAILIPKVASPGDIMFAAADLTKAGAPGDLRLWAMVETPAAILNAIALARTAADPASRLDVMVMGTNDLAKDTRGQGPARPGPDGGLAVDLRRGRALREPRHHRRRVQRT